MSLDFRFALRSLLRARGFALAVILTLGLGIGANTAIFSVVRGVLLKPLPHKDGERLVYLRQSAAGVGAEDIAFSVPEINDFRDASKTMGGIAEYSPITFTLVEKDNASRIDIGLVTGNFFTVMGLSPVLGRAFTAADDGPTAAPVMMLTHDYWIRHFGGDSAVIGKELRVNGRAVPVVGVLQAAPNFPQRMDALMNMVISEHHVSATMVTGRTHRMTQMIARLAPGASVEQARAEVATIRSRVQKDHPDAYDAASNYKVELFPFREILGQDARLTLILLMGAAAFVLVIACANVANLTLMRSVRREHELTVRAALGAGTRGLRRLLLVENLILAALGGVLGLAIAYAGVGMLVKFAERVSARANEIAVDGTVLGFTVLLSVLVAVLLSYAPKLAHEGELGTQLAAGGKRGGGGVRRKRLQQALVVTQLAVSVVLLTGAGLLTRTMQKLAETDDGLNGENVLTLQVPFDYNGDPNVAKAAYEKMRNDLATIPGVTNVGYGSTMPLSTAGFQLDIKAENRPLAAGEPQPRSEFRTASPEYFEAAGIPLIKGRYFSTTDREGGARVVIVNQALADKLFPGQDPIGRRVAWTGDVLKFIPVSPDWRTIVGVVGNTKDGGLDAPEMPATFMPWVQEAFPSGGLILRARSDAEALAGAATKVVRNVVPQNPIERVLTIDQIRDESVGPRRLNALLVGSFGILALVVAAIGIAAVLAFSVAARTNEIGIRMSLGATGGRVQRMIISEGGILVVIGLAIGIIGALSLSRLISGLLFGVPPYDPVSVVAVVMLMALIGLVACWVPALRAARIDPATAIRAN